MATEKMFSIAGISTLNNETKLRFANEVSRIKVLVKNGHTDIKLINLPESMSKLECVRYLCSDESFQDNVSQELFEEYLSKNAPAKFVSKGPAVHASEDTDEVAEMSE